MSQTPEQSQPVTQARRKSTSGIQEHAHAEISDEMRKFMDQAKQCEWIGDITKLEIRQHQSKDDLWVSFDGNVYNVTQFLEWHPTGASCFINAPDHDITQSFKQAHIYIDPAILEKCKIGTLVVSH